MDDPSSSDDVANAQPMTAPSNTRDARAFVSESTRSAPVSDEDDPGFVLGYN